MAGTPSSEYLRSLGIVATEMPTIDDATAVLRDKGCDAVVFDAPVLQYWVSHDGEGVGILPGGVLQPEDYGMAFCEGSELSKRVDEALLTMREDGTYAAIKQKWFGTDE